MYRYTHTLSPPSPLPYNFSLESLFGQRQRRNIPESILPDGTGLSDRLYDIVRRTTVRYRDFISVTHRFRVYKDKLAVRRNEIDATVGSRKTYATVGYLRLNRDADRNLEDLQDREELQILQNADRKSTRLNSSH